MSQKGALASPWEFKAMDRSSSFMLHARLLKSLFSKGDRMSPFQILVPLQGTVHSGCSTLTSMGSGFLFQEKELKFIGEQNERRNISISCFTYCLKLVTI